MDFEPYSASEYLSSLLPPLNDPNLSSSSNGLAFAKELDF